MKPESFVPLTAATVKPEPREFRVAILNGHNQAQNGNGAEKGGKAGEFQALEVQRPAAFSNLAGATDKKNCEPRVSVQREGDRVTMLRIQCSCGQIMELACVYQKSGAEAQE